MLRRDQEVTKRAADTIVVKILGVCAGNRHGRGLKPCRTCTVARARPTSNASCQLTLANNRRDNNDAAAAVFNVAAAAAAVVMSVVVVVVVGGRGDRVGRWWSLVIVGGRW